MHLTTIFDAASINWGAWWGLVVCLAFTAGFAFLFWASRNIDTSNVHSLLAPPLAVLVVISAVVAVVSISDFASVLALLRGGNYSVVEGPVENFTPPTPPETGKKAFESFTVGGHLFSYADSPPSPGFHQTSANGGPIYPGLYVRITYAGNMILRLEISQ